MNIDQLKKNIGNLVQLVPPLWIPRTRGRGGSPADDDWKVEAVDSDGSVLVTSQRGGQSFTLAKDHVHSFTSNPQGSRNSAAVGFLSLKVQPYSDGGTIRVRPVSRPGEPGLRHVHTAGSITYQDVIEIIQNSDPHSDWIHTHTMSDDRSIAVFAHDVNLRLEIKWTDDGIQCEKFMEAWATGHPDQNATGYWCCIYYGVSLLEKTVLVSVDGGRARLPIPGLNTGGGPPLSVRPLDFAVAKIFDTGSMAEYMERSGLVLGSDEPRGGRRGVHVDAWKSNVFCIVDVITGKDRCPAQGSGWDVEAVAQIVGAMGRYRQNGDNMPD